MGLGKEGMPTTTRKLMMVLVLRSAATARTTGYMVGTTPVNTVILNAISDWSGHLRVIRDWMKIGRLVLRPELIVCAIATALNSSTIWVHPRMAYKSSNGPIPVVPTNSGC